MLRFFISNVSVSDSAEVWWTDRNLTCLLRWPRSACSLRWPRSACSKINNHMPFYSTSTLSCKFSTDFNLWNISHFNPAPSPIYQQQKPHTHRAPCPLRPCCRGYRLICSTHVWKRLFPALVFHSKRPQDYFGLTVMQNNNNRYNNPVLLMKWNICFPLLN